MAGVDRAIVEIYLAAYEDRGEAVAALVEDFPELEKLSPLHKRPVIEVLLHDLDSYSGQ